TAELYYPVTWTSSDTTVATVDTGGLIRARAPGRAGIFGTAHGRADTVRLYVRAPSAPLLVSLSDSAVNAGDTLTIAGAGLGSPGIDTVWIAGVPSMITSAADTQIVAVVPAATQYSCASPGPVSLRVTVGREFRDTLVSLTVAPTATLAVGDVLRLTGAPARCLSFPVLSGSYLVGVANTAAVTRSFELQVDSAGRQQVPPPPNWPTALRSGSRGPQTADGQSPLGLTRIISERMRGVIHSLWMQQRGGPRAAMTGPTMAPPTFFPGATTVLKVPVLDAPDPCSTFSQVQARVVYAGAHVVMMEDADAPLAGQMDPVITSVGTDLDGHAFSVLATNLGNPLAAFPGGKMVVLMTPQANAYGTDAFSAGCDFYAPSVAPSSNQEPVIYAAVPTDPGTGYSAFTAQAWAWAVPASLVNLGAHLTTFGVRLAAGAPPEQAWLDEAIAEATVEIWDRQYSGVVWKENAGYQASLYCEVRPTFPSCTGHPFAMFGAFETLYQYDLAAPARSPLGGAPGDFTFPAGAWWLLRTTIDHYASTESGFLSALVHEPSLTGLANLTARAGAPAGTVLADWMVYSYGAGDPNFGALPASLTTGSWDSHNIFSGMHNDFPQQFGFFPLSPMPLGGVQTFYGGGAAIGQFGVGVPTAEALGLTSPAGGVADPAVFLTIVRVY
ncbi:MAG TPA: IPT/TIG domain-containing protein, partial [Gemmatimonadales bacterium]|nr:IPT/TIG domain-containing protein [Gemmatimonadales bacterium]